MSLNAEQKQITAQELQQNYRELNLTEEQVLADLEFTKEQLYHALHMSAQTSGYDVWKLRDYLEEKITELGKPVHPFSILKTNRWFHYDKTW